MPCTTLLVGKKASYDGSTIIARTDDGNFDVKKYVIVNPDKQKRKYKSVISHVEIDLPDNPLSYSSCPSVDPKHGIWAAQGINSANVGMTATETTTSNALVLGADPLVFYKKATKKGQKDTIGGIGEEDLVVITLPYIKSAREGVIRLGSLIEKYGTYESNGIAFHDDKEIWWFESIGGHHYAAKKVDDEKYVIMPNQFGLDDYDIEDGLTTQINHICSKDLKKFIDDNHLDCNNTTKISLRKIFGSHSEQDHVYNTPRAWYMARYFNPRSFKWEGDNPDYSPTSDDIPWSLVPERKITVEDVKTILSSNYEGTPYNPYSKADNPLKGIYRTIGISRTGVTIINQIRPYLNDEIKSLTWVCFASNAFNAALPIYPLVPKAPAYISSTTLDVDTTNFYWGSRVLGTLADSCYGSSIQLIERYQLETSCRAHALLNEYEKKMIDSNKFNLKEEFNNKICEIYKELTNKTLNEVLLVSGRAMKNSYYRKDH